MSRKQRIVYECDACHKEYGEADYNDSGNRAFIESMEKEQPQIAQYPQDAPLGYSNDLKPIYLEDIQPKIKGWVARLKNGELELGSNKQRYYEFRGEMHIADEGPVMLIDKSLFPELHWLDEPIEVELTLKKI